MKETEDERWFEKVYKNNKLNEKKIQTHYFIKN